MEYAVKRGWHRHLQLLLRLLSHCLLYFSTKQDLVVGLSWCPVTVLPNSEACMLFVGQPNISTHLKKIWPNRAWYKFCCSLLLRPICFHRRGTYESLAIRDYHYWPDTIMVSIDCWGMIWSLIFSYPPPSSIGCFEYAQYGCVYKQFYGQWCRYSMTDWLSLSYHFSLLLGSAGCLRWMHMWWDCCPCT